MKTIVPCSTRLILQGLLLTFLLISTRAYTQATLEFASGGGPSGSGPSTAAQVVTFQNNINNPGGNTFSAFTPTTTATFSIQNQQYTSPYNCLRFGANAVIPAGNSSTPAAATLYPLMSGVGAPVNANFTSASKASSGVGIDTTINNAVWLFASTSGIAALNTALPAAGAFSRFYMGDLVITFNHGVTNPVIHFGGMGAFNPSTSAFSTEAELTTSGLTLTRLSGSTEFSVPTTGALANKQVLNSATTITPTTGSGAGSGSVVVNGTGITTVTFKIYLKGQRGSSPTGTNSTDWGYVASGTAKSNGGDAISVGVSLNACEAGTSSPTLSTTLTGTCSANPVNLDSFVNSTTPTGASLIWNNSSGAYVAMPTSVAGDYVAYYYDAVNTCFSPASVAIKVVNDCDSDGDGIKDSLDLDDDNDGILDTAEGICTATSALSSTGWLATVYDAPTGTASWLEVSAATTFPTASYSKIAAFNYNEFAGTSNAFNIEFASGTIGINSSHPKAINYAGTAIAGNPANTNEDYAVMFNKTIASTEAGTYAFDLLYGDDDIYIYKNGVKVYQLQSAYNTTPVNNVATISVVAGDVLSMLMVEEYQYNTEIKIQGRKISGSCSLTDTDADGIPNYLDLDSDNDGCVDAREGDENVKASQLTTASGTVTVGAGSSASNQNLGITVDANGVPTVVNSGGAADIGPDQGQGIGVSQDSTKSDCIDSDGDGVADWSDLDDDNDGILDTNEAKCSTLGAETYSSINSLTDAQTAQSVTLQSTSNANTPFATNTSYTINYGTGNGKKITAINFASGKKLSLLSNSQTMNFYVRRNTSSSLASNEILWLESAGTSLTSAQNILLSKPVTLQSVFSNGYYNAGFDNVFSNDSATNPSFSNIERLDVIFTTPFISVNPTTDYVLLTERGVNDNILVAAVTAVDGSGVPTSLGSVQTIST